MSVHVITGGKPAAAPAVEINHQAIAILKSTLALFEAGDADSLAIVWFGEDGAHSNAFSTDSLTYCVGAVASMQARIIEALRA